MSCSLVDSDISRRCEEFLDRVDCRPSVSRTIVDYLGQQIQQERQSWLTKVSDTLQEVERLRKQLLFASSSSSHHVEVTDCAIQCDTPSYDEMEAALINMNRLTVQMEDQLSTLMADRRRSLYFIKSKTSLLQNFSVADEAEMDLSKMIRELINQLEEYKRQENIERKAVIHTTAASQSNLANGNKMCSKCCCLFPSPTPIGQSTVSLLSLDESPNFHKQRFSLRLRGANHHKSLQRRVKPSIDKVNMNNASVGAFRLSTDNSYSDNRRLLSDAMTLTNTLRQSEEENKILSNRLHSYERQIGDLKHAVAFHPVKLSSELPVHHPLANKKSTNRTAVTRCLRCQQLYRSSDNSRMACKYHPKGKRKIEQNGFVGRYADNYCYVWECCGRDTSCDGCCFTEHV